MATNRFLNAWVLCGCYFIENVITAGLHFGVLAWFVILLGGIVKIVKKPSVGLWLALMVLVLVVVWGLGALKPKSQVNAITKEGVVTEIRRLNRLTTVAFSVDTVITAKKTGTWYKLWQDEQKGLFVAHGRVLAGVDLAKLTPEMVDVRQYQSDPDAQAITEISVDLPASEVFEVYLDNIQVYDWQTGLFGIVDNDPEVLNHAQTQGKIEVLSKACDGQIMQMALSNAKDQISALFMMTGAKVVVRADKVGQCRLGANLKTSS